MVLCAPASSSDLGDGDAERRCHGAKWTFVEIVPAGLTVIVTFSDEKQGITRHPLSPTWPRETYSVTTLTEKDGKTHLRLQWTAYHATAEEQATFDAAHDGMTQGWSGSTNALDAYLKTLGKRS